MMKIKKPPLWASIFTVAGFCVLCVLGTWQLQRLEWKTQLLLQIDREYAKDAENSRLDRALIQQAAKARYPYIRGKVSGFFNYDKEVLLGPRSADGKFLNDVLTPLSLLDGSTLFVIRGGAPEGGTTLGVINKQRQDKQEWVIGTVKTPFNNFFMPENKPEDDKWFRLDIEQIARAKNITNVLPLVLYAEDASYSEEEWPQIAEYRRSKPDLNNNHLAYAVFWFSLAGILIVIFVLRFRVFTQT